MNMCGIAGILSLNPNKPIHLKELEAIFQGIKHRGPDNTGVFMSNLNGQYVITKKSKSPDFPIFLALLHARLSIIDLSPKAAQPMCRGHLCLVHNGEIYNFQELKAELKDDFDFSTKTDSEVVLAGILKWGWDFYERANGMWADAIWDRRNQTLYLVRDRLGIKPIYYSVENERFAFASEIKALLKLFESLRTLNLVAAFEFINFRWIDHSHETLVKGIFQVPAGQIVRVTKNGNISVVRSLKLKTRTDITGSPPAVLRALLDDSVRLRLISDVPVGVLLSGGIDSTGIASLAVRRKKGLKAFTVTYPNLDGELKTEIENAKLVASDLGLEHYFISITPGYFVHLLKSFVHQIDLPFFSASMFAEYAIIRFANLAGVKVVLSGQGADELFAGYPPYWATMLASLVRKRDWLTLLKTLNMLPIRLKKQAVSICLMQIAPKPVRKRLIELTMPLLDDFRNALKHTEISRKIEQAFERQVEYRGICDLNKRLMLDTLKYHLPALLRYIDRNSMAHGVEARVPYLDHRIVEFAFSIAEDWKMRDGFTKFVLREALKGLVPDEIRLSKVKLGFPTPLFSWMKGPMRFWIEEILQNSKLLNSILHPSRILKIWLDFLEKNTNGDLIWRIVSLELWMKSFGIEMPKF